MSFLTNPENGSPGIRRLAHSLEVAPCLLMTVQQALAPLVPVLHTALHLILFPVEACCESGDDWGTVTKPKDDKRFIFSRAGRDRYYCRANVAPQVLVRVKQKTRSPPPPRRKESKNRKTPRKKTYVRDVRRSDQTTPSFKAKEVSG